MTIRHVLPLLLSAFGAQAQPLQSRAWSDARLLPAPADTRSNLLAEKALRCSAGGPGAAGDADARAALARLEAMLGALPAGDPNRAALVQTVHDLRQDAARAPAPRPTTPAGPPTLAQALANARAWLRAHDAAGVRAFAASPASRSAAVASEQAMQASMLGKPNAAVAALLAAHTLAPKNADTLVNLGGALDMLGLPQEALTVLKAALTPAGQGALGISQRAVALNNQGHALLQLGRWADADRVLGQALTLEPALAEASINRAQALLCQGQTAAAVTAQRRGTRRTPPGRAPGTTDLPLTPSGQEPPDQTQRPAAFSFDLSRGAQTTLPDLKLPATPEETAALAGRYQQLDQELTARALKLKRRQDAVEQQLNARGDTVPAVDERRDALWWAILRADQQPGLAALKARMDTSGGEPSRLWGDFWHCEGGCTIDVITQQATLSAHFSEQFHALCVPKLKASHNAWRGAMHNAATDLGAYLKADYAYETALAANYSDPLWHELASLQAEIGATVLFGALVNDARLWATDIAHSPNCLEGSVVPPAATQDVAAPLELPRSPLCRQLFDGFSASVSLSVVGFSVSCDTFAFKVSNPGWIGAFGKVSVNTATRDWQTTVTIGVAQSVGIPGTGVGLGASQGAYLTVNRQGQVLDLGMVADAGASASGKFGPIKIGKGLGKFSGQWSFIASVH